MELNQRLQDLFKKTLLVDYYESKGMELSNQLASFAKKSYTNGEIGYIEYLSILDQATSLKQEYISSLIDYNLLIIDIKNLLGTYN